MGWSEKASGHVTVDLNFNETAVCTSAWRAFQEDARSKGSESGARLGLNEMKLG